jgi:hypothetical protein
VESNRLVSCSGDLIVPTVASCRQAVTCASINDDDDDDDDDDNDADDTADLYNKVRA